MRTNVIAWAVVVSMVSHLAAVAADFVKGKVVEVDHTGRTVTLEHGDIPNLEMPGMTMTFRVAADLDIADFKPGASIEFTAGNVDDELTVTAVRQRAP